jgi:hypothetical protein
VPRRLWTLGAAGLGLSLVLVPLGYILGQSLFRLGWSYPQLVVFGILLGVGCLNLLYADVSAAIGARGDADTLRWFVIGLCMTLALGTAVALALGLLLGAVGVAAGALVAYSTRLGLGVRCAVRL